jgi:hypothetical protein
MQQQRDTKQRSPCLAVLTTTHFWCMVPMLLYLHFAHCAVVSHACHGADYWGLQHPTINLAAYTRHGLNVSNFTEAESGQVLLDR